LLPASEEADDRTQNRSFLLLEKLKKL